MGVVRKLSLLEMRNILYIFLAACDYRQVARISAIIQRIDKDMGVDGSPLSLLSQYSELSKKYNDLKEKYDKKMAALKTLGD